MPYKVVRMKSGWTVKNLQTGRLHSTHPMTRKNAMEQMRLLYAVENKDPNFKKR